MNPTLALGLLWQVEPGSEHRFLGSCFSLRWGHFFVAPSHCLGTLQPAQVRVSSATLLMTQPEEITHHGGADICVLRLRQLDFEPGVPFWGIAESYEPGEEFNALGWPEDCLADIAAAGLPIPEGDPPWAKVRLLSGTYQRFIPHYAGDDGFSFLAGELSIPCPLGLSGGPLFGPQTPQMVTGMVVGNLRTRSAADVSAHVHRDGTIHEEEHSRVIDYGVALMLDHVEGWLNEHVPWRD